MGFYFFPLEIKSDLRDKDWASQLTWLFKKILYQLYVTDCLKYGPGLETQEEACEPSREAEHPSAIPGQLLKNAEHEGAKNMAGNELGMFSSVRPT